MSTHTEYKDPRESLAEASIVCRQLGALVEEENESLKAHEITKIEGNLKRKNKLALKLGKLLKDVKEHKDEIRLDPAARKTVMSVQLEMDGFSRAARKNLLMLKTAHQTRSDTLQIIRQAIVATTPRTEVYNASGLVKDATKKVSLVNRSI